MNWFTKTVCALGTMLAFLSVLPVSLQAQATNAATVSFGPVLTPYTTIAANAPYRVCLASAVGVPCPTTGVLLYSDINLTQPLSNPSFANSQGIVNFFTTAGFYQIQVTPVPGATYLYYSFLGGGGSSSFLAYVNGVPVLTAGSANFINSSSIIFTNTSTNQIQATVVGSPSCTTDCIISDPTTANRPPDGDQTITQPNGSMFTLQDTSSGGPNNLTFTPSATNPELFLGLQDGGGYTGSNYWTQLDAYPGGFDIQTDPALAPDNPGETGLFVDDAGITADTSYIGLITYDGGNIEVRANAGGAASNTEAALEVESNLTFSGGGNTSSPCNPAEGHICTTVALSWIAQTGISVFSLNATSAGYTVTLPVAAGPAGPTSAKLWFYKSDSTGNTVVLAAHAGDTINGNSSISLSTPGEEVELTGDGYNNWYVMGLPLSNTATNLAGGALGSLPYQSAAGTTTFVASPTTSGHAFVPMWNPSGSIIAPTAVDLGSYLGTNVTGTSPITVTPTTLGFSISCATCSTSATGTTVAVNGGSTLGSLNINATSPLADSSYIALLPKISGSDMIIEAPYATGAAFGVMEGDASTITMTAGVASCTTATSSQLGCVKPDGTIITDTAGAITVPKTSSSVFGVVEVDNTTITASAGVISAVSKISGGTSGEVAIFGSASTITSAIALGTTGSDIPQLSSGLLNNSVVNWAAPSAIGTGTPAAGTFSALTLSSITGSAQCLHVNSSGTVSGTGADCGSGGSGVPGGSSGQIQWNNGGVFAGLTMSGDATIVASTGAITVSKSGGVAFGSAAFEPTSYFQTALGYTPAHAGANSDITSLAGLTTPLSVPQGGTGIGTLTGYIYGNGTSAFSAATTIPGSVITGPIPGASSNVYGTPTLPNGTLAFTQSANDNTQKLATTAYVKTPGNITPTGITLTGSGPSTIGLPGVTYATLQAAFPCASNQGRIASVTDSTTTTVGAVITGGGSNFVFAACKGTAWQVLL